MGPRLFSRGRVETRAPAAHRDVVASMGPRLFSRGRSGRTSCCSLIATSFNGAAAVQPRKAHFTSWITTKTKKLQWGRGCSAAEGTSADAQPGRSAGFNGAAAVQPRKERILGEYPDATAASMGPRLFSRGRRPTSPGCGRPTSGFNGAAAVQPRKAAPASICLRCLR